MLKSGTYIDEIVKIIREAGIVPDVRVVYEIAYNPLWDGRDEINVLSSPLTPLQTQCDPIGYQSNFVIVCISRIRDRARDMSTQCAIALAENLPIDTWMKLTESITRMQDGGDSIEEGWLSQQTFTIYTMKD